MSFRLRYQQHDLELVPGEFLIGRSAECQLSLDDPLVSRRHAVLMVEPGSVTVRDLGSRNGVLVNGVRIEQERVLSHGDRLTIGTQKLTVSEGSGPVSESRSPELKRRSETLTWMPAVAEPSEPPSSAQPGEISKRIDSLQLLGALADKALALGKHEEAERILSSSLLNTLRAMQNGQSVAVATIEQAGRYGTKLASATGKGIWVDYVVKLYVAVDRPFPAAIVDELHAALRRVGAFDLSSFRAYLGRLRERAPSFGPAERFLLQRIEGLERFASLR